MSATQQKALYLPEKFGKWQIEHAAIPTPGPKDVLIKIFAAALNPVDWKIQTYGVLVENFPYVSGSDGAGIVEAVGDEVKDLVKGDKVVFQGFFANNSHGTFQQYCIIPADITAKIPENISFDQASSIPLGLATVVTGLYNHDPAVVGKHSADLTAPWEPEGQTKYANKPVFITGGASSVGQYAIQIAKLAKFSPIITTASLHNATLLKSQGATHVLDRSLSSSDLLQKLKEITAGAPIELVYDAIGVPDVQAAGYAALARGGALVSVALIASEILQKKDADGKTTANVYGNVHPPFNRKVGVEVYSRLTQWLETGVIVPNRVEVVPGGLAGIPEGLDRMKENKVSGLKLVVHPQETL